MNESSKIIQDTKYSISTPFFKFTSTENDKYQISYQNNTNKPNPKKQQERFSIVILLSLNLFCILTRLTYYCLTGE